MAGKPSTSLPRRNSFCQIRQVSETEKKEMGKPSKFEETGSGKKAKVKLIEKNEVPENSQQAKETKPEEINIMSLFHLIQETAKEQRENIRRIEDSLEKNNDQGPKHQTDKRHGKGHGRRQEKRRGHPRAQG